MNPSFFGLDALGCMRHFHQPLLGDQLAGGFADAVCLVLDAYAVSYTHLRAHETPGLGDVYKRQVLFSMRTSAISRLRMNFI